MRDTPIPLALVAHHGSSFLGTASVIASDLDERPELTPWVAALWVEESREARASAQRWSTPQHTPAFTLGFRRAYLCAQAANDALLRTPRLDDHRAKGRPAAAQRIRQEAG